MESHYCDHSWPVPEELDALSRRVSPFPLLAELDTLLEPLLPAGLRESSSSHALDTFTTLDECGKFLNRLAPHEWIRWGYEERSQKIEEASLRCVLYLYNQENRRQAIHLMRDALLLYHRSRGDRYQGEWHEHLLKYLFLLRFWDSDSVVDLYDERWGIYRHLLFAHIPPREPAVDELVYRCAFVPRSFVDCPEPCLMSFFSCIGRANPASMLESISALYNEASRLETIQRDGEEGKGQAAFYEAIKEVDESGVPLHINYLESVRNKIAKVLFALNVPASEFVLHTLTPIARAERELLSSILELPLLDLLTEDFCHDLAHLADLIRQGAFSPTAVQRVRHFQRSRARLDGLKEDWASPDRFDLNIHGELAVAFPSLEALGPAKQRSLLVALDETDEALRLAMAPLPRTPLLLERSDRPRTFYFGFLIDHENFWNALLEHMKRDYPNLYTYLPPLTRNLPEGRSQWRLFETLEESKTNVYFNAPSAYYAENKRFMQYVTDRLKETWRVCCGVEGWDFARAVLYGRFFPLAHTDVYKDFGTRPDEPQLPPTKRSEAADRKIVVLMGDIWTAAEALEKKPYYVIVSGDADYFEALDPWHEKGAEYQYWYFRGQSVKRRLRDLEENRRVWLEDILQLDRFSFEGGD